MVNIWDYLMRRKPLFLVVLGIFLACGLLVFSLVRKYSVPVSTTDPTDIVVADNDSSPGNDMVATPDKPINSTQDPQNTTESSEPLPRLRLKIANPGEIAALDHNSASDVPDNSSLDPPVNDNVAESTSTDSSIEVPLTGKSDPVRTWYNITVSTTLTLLLGLLAIAGVRLIYSYYRAK